MVTLLATMLVSVLAFVIGLLALMLLHDSRRDARAAGAGALVTLDEQDRALWDRAQIEEGRECIARALTRLRRGTTSTIWPSSTPIRRAFLGWISTKPSGCLSDSPFERLVGGAAL